MRCLAAPHLHESSLQARCIQESFVATPVNKKQALYHFKWLVFQLEVCGIQAGQQTSGSPLSP